jgi:hypothetical protein
MIRAEIHWFRVEIFAGKKGVLCAPYPMLRLSHP